jgi:hypothetical protein
MTDHDEVSRPAHYTTGGIQCIEALESAMSAQQFEGFLRGNALKYLWRYPAKGGLQDLQKAQWYLARLIAHLSPDPEPWQPAAEHDPQAVAEAMTRLRAEHPAVEVPAQDGPPVPWAQVPGVYRYQTVSRFGVVTGWVERPKLGMPEEVWFGDDCDSCGGGTLTVVEDGRYEPGIWERP